jgi:hypothetical protein
LFADTFGNNWSRLATAPPGEAMFIWPALVIAPLLVLANLGLVQAMTGVGCEEQPDRATYGVALLCFLAVAVFTALAWRETHRAEGVVSSHDRHFLAILATEAGALSGLSIAAMWLPRWALSCMT